MIDADILCVKIRDVLDFTFPNPVGARFGRIYELKL